SLTAGERAHMVPDIAELTLEVLQPEAPNYIQKCLNDFKHSDHSIEFNVKNEDNRLYIKFLGKSAHGSRPYEGKNAGVIALKFLLHLRVAPPSIATFIEFLWRAGEDLWGEALGIKSEHYFVGRTTSSLGLLRLGSRGGTAVFNIRNTLGLSVAETEEKIQRVLQQLKEKTGIEINLRRTSKGTEALFVDPEKFRHYIEPLQVAYEAVTGKKSAPKAIGGTTFAKAFPRAVSFGPVLPEEEPELAHQVNEHVTIEHQLRNTKIYALALAGLISNARL
ncbi:MAG: peptidase dimerization domain-containing protein, partial [Candidatus Sumerlaeia bacterium]|nr:peptidase dimerization domain-containing protein [Candidatus Sumerlaeia bacterium]